MCSYKLWLSNWAKAFLFLSGSSVGAPWCFIKALNVHAFTSKTLWWHTTPRKSCSANGMIWPSDFLHLTTLTMSVHTTHTMTQSWTNSAKKIKPEIISLHLLTASCEHLVLCIVAMKLCWSKLLFCYCYKIYC